MYVIKTQLKPAHQYYQEIQLNASYTQFNLIKKKETAPTLSGKDDMIALHILFFSLICITNGRIDFHPQIRWIYSHLEVFSYPSWVFPEKRLLLFCQNTLYGEQSEVIQSLAPPLPCFSETGLI